VLSTQRLEVLDARMAERGIDQEHYARYRDLHRAQRERDGKPASPCAPGSIA
jgi:hypothetical protein